MADRNRPPRRPVVGSRNPTARPRKVAGGAPGPGEPMRSAEPVETTRPSRPVETAGPASSSPDPVETSPTARVLGGRRTTAALVAALVLLIGAGAVEGWYLWFRGDPVVSAQRPVVTGEIAHRAAVEAASQSITEILTYGYQDFDAQIEEAATKMTGPFAQQFRETAGAVKAEFLEERMEQEVEVVAASVVQASPDEVQTLLFIDQYVAKQGKGTAVTPFRALVTVVHTDQGWLVSGIQTK